MINDVITLAIQQTVAGDIHNYLFLLVKGTTAENLRKFLLFVLLALDSGCFPLNLV